jgi:hypothetical protein
VGNSFEKHPEETMRKFVISFFCAALMLNASASFAKDKKPAKEGKPYWISSGFLALPLVIPYDGPIQPRGSTSILVIARDTRINSIDGQRIDDQGLRAPMAKNPVENSDIIQLLPGKHVIGISYKTQDSTIQACGRNLCQGSIFFATSFVEVNFESTAGRTYLANANGFINKNRSSDYAIGFKPEITDITEALDEKENQNLDESVKNEKKIYRISDWLAARQAASTKSGMHGLWKIPGKQELQTEPPASDGYYHYPPSADKK